MILYGDHGDAINLVEFIDTIDNSWIILVVNGGLLMCMILAKFLIFRQKKNCKYGLLKLISVLLFLPVYIADFFFIMYYASHDLQWWYSLYSIRFACHLIKLVIPFIFWDLIMAYLDEIGNRHATIIQSIDNKMS
jgi:hypothetical protein